MRRNMLCYCALRGGPEGATAAERRGWGAAKRGRIYFQKNKSVPFYAAYCQLRQSSVNSKNGYSYVSLQRISSICAPPISAMPRQALSLVSTRVPRRRAKAKHARSPKESPNGFVAGSRSPAP